MNLEDIQVEKELKIVFMGTPDFSVPVLEGLLEHYKIRAVVTQPDHPCGRHGEVRPSPIKEVAQKHTLLVLQPEKIRENYQEIIDLEPDLIITCAYGQIIPEALLNAPKLGCINVHASLLPKLRGGAPIHRAIIEGYRKTGITIMYMNAKMDEGDIISQKETEILDTDTATTLHDRLMMLGRDLLLETLPSILDKTNSRVKQDVSLVTYAFTIKREDEQIDFAKTKRQIYNLVRGLNSWPGAYCRMGGHILKIWECYMTENVFPQLLNGQITNVYSDGIGVKVSNGEVVFTLIQPEGKQKMKVRDFLNGIQKKEELVGKILE